MASGSSRSLANNNILFYRRRKSGSGSDADFLLLNETQGLALDFTDDFFYASEGFYGSARIKDTGTPANEYNSSPTKTASSLLTMTAPSPKLTMGPSGTLRYQAHNLYLNSASPANQSVTVVSGATYSVILTGSVTTTLSGAATGTITAGTTSFTAATTTLTFGSTSGTGTVQVTRTPADLTYLATAGSARYALPLQWTSAGVLEGMLVEEARTNNFTYSNDWSNAAWFKSSTASAVKNATGPDGVANSGSTLTFSGAGTIGRSITKGGAAIGTASVYVKRTGALSGSVFASYSNATEGSGLITGDDSDFDTIGNWVDRSTGTGTATITAGTLRLTQVDASNRGRAELALTGLTIGRVYRIGADFATISGAPSIGVSAYTGANFTGDQVVGFTAVLASGQNFHFVATATTMYLTIATGGAGTSFAASVDNVTLLLTTETDITSSITTDWTRITTTQSGTVQHPAFALRTTAADTLQVSLAQEEAGAFATSPIETFASTVTRAADNISLATSAFPHSTSSGTWFAHWAQSSVAGGVTTYVVENDANSLMVYVSAASVRSFDGTNILTNSSITANTFNKAANTYGNTNEMAGSVNGAAAVAQTFDGTMGAGATINFGSLNGSSGFVNNVIKQITFRPRRVANAELQTLTT